MTEFNKKSLFFAVLKDFRGWCDPTIIKKFIQILDDWLPNELEYEEDDRGYNKGWNDCLEEIRKNLK